MLRVVTVYFYPTECQNYTMGIELKHAMKVGVTLAGLALAGISAGCSGGTAAPSFTDTTGHAVNTPPAYPAPPYGLGIGSVIENYEFLGFPAPQQSTSSAQPVRLSDFYNPHGKDPSYQPPAGAEDDRYFPKTSAYATAGQLKPTVLLIDVASVWCGPCNQEAQTDLPAKHTLYSPCGGEFLLQLADGPSVGTPATEKNLLNWTTRYSVDYPGVIDPSNKLQPLFQENAFPENIVVDTTTMKIVEVLAGEAIPGFCSDQSATCSSQADCPAQTTCQLNPFWATYESLLDKTRTGCTLH